MAPPALLFPFLQLHNLRIVHSGGDKRLLIQIALTLENLDILGLVAGCLGVNTVQQSS